MTDLEKRLQWAGTIGRMNGLVNFLSELVEGGEVAGCGYFADVNQKGLTRVLDEVRQLLDQQSDLLENM